MKFKNWKELSEVIEYEKQRWLEANHLDSMSKTRGIREIEYVTSLRFVEYFQQFPKWLRPVRGGVLYVYHRLRYNRLCTRNNVWIMPGCFDKGLVLRHCQNIVISAQVRGGRDCTVLHNVTIGVSFSKPGVPRIGNNVLVCCGAGIYGDVEIADNVTIGANAVVTKSCKEAGTVLVGVPAREIKKGSV